MTRIIRAIAFRLATMPNTRWFIARVFSQSLDEDVERSHFRGMLLEVFGPGIVAGLLFVNFVMAPIQDAPVVGPLADRALPDMVMVFEPGTGFNVAAYCKQAQTVGTERIPGAEVVGVKRFARNSNLDYVSWLDNDGNTAATRYYVDRQGQAQYETVDVEGAVQCLRTQR